jgi:hypothetical protein
MPLIGSIKFDTTGWTLDQESSDVTKWSNDKNQYLSLHFFEESPDIPCRLDNLDGLRSAYRNGLTHSGGALISVDRVQAGGMDCIKLLFKTKKPDHGMVYVGSLTFPFADFSYVVKVQCAESGVTGMRDAIVMDQLMAVGVVSLDPQTKVVAGWSSDPYDPEFRADFLRNQSDDEAYDAQFPEHPLSEVRGSLARIIDSIAADDAVLKSSKFESAQSPEMSGNGQGDTKHEQSGSQEKKEEADRKDETADKGGQESKKQGEERKEKPWWKVW